MPYEKISHLIESQVPEFIRNDFPDFVSFIQAYYRWSEEEGNPFDRLSSILEAKDIDGSIVIDSFVDAMKKDYLIDIPQTVLTDTSLLLKNIKEFYASRGTEKSFKLLFRILFDVDVDFYYPKVDMLRSSDGNWIRNSVFYINVSSGDINDLVNRKILGSISNATSIVESVALEDADNTTYKITTNIDTLSENYIVGDSISIVNKPLEIITVHGTVVSVLTDLPITTAGSGYSTDPIFIYPLGGSVESIPHATISKVSKGDLTHITILTQGLGYQVNDTLVFNHNSGWGAFAYVDSTDSTGGIASIIISHTGYNYTTTPTISGIDGTFGTSLGSGATFTTDSTTIGAIEEIIILRPFLDFSDSSTYVNNLVDINSTLGTDATIGFTFGSNTTDTGHYVGNDGKLSEDKFLQDNWYYQDFSYLLRSSIEFSRFESVLDKILHPAGMLLISSIFDIPIEFVPGSTPAIASASSNPVNYILRTVNNVSITIDDTLKYKIIIHGPEGFDTGNNEKFNNTYDSFGRQIQYHTNAGDPTSEYQQLSDATLNITTELVSVTPAGVLGIYYETGNDYSSNTAYIHRDETYVIWEHDGVFTLSSSFDGTTIFDSTIGAIDDATFDGSDDGTGNFLITSYTYDYDQTHDGSSGVYGSDRTSGIDPSIGSDYRNYYKYFGDIQLKHISHLILGDFINKPNKKINICPEANISVYKYK